MPNLTKKFKTWASVLNVKVRSRKRRRSNNGTRPYRALSKLDRHEGEQEYDAPAQECDSGNSYVAARQVRDGIEQQRAAGSRCEKTRYHRSGSSAVPMAHCRKNFCAITTATMPTGTLMKNAHGHPNALIR